MGTVLAQLIPIAIQPVIRRIYTDTETGRFDVYLSIVSILVSFVHLNYARVVVIPKEDKSAVNLLSGAVLSSFVFAIVFFVVFTLAGEEFLELFNLPMDILPWLNFVPLSVFFIGAYTSMGVWLTRKKRFKAVAYNKFLRRSTEGVTQITSKAFSGNGLIIGSIIGDLFNFIAHVFQVKKSGFSLEDIELKEIKKEFIRYKDFPLYSMLPTLLNTLSANLPIIIIGGVYTEQIVGQFGLSRMVLAIPLALVSVAISQVLLQKTAEKAHKKESIFPLVKSLFFVLAGLSLLGTIIIYFFSDTIFTIAFGKEWMLASEMSRILIFSFAVSFVVSPFSVLLISLERIKLNSFWQILHFLLILALYRLGDIGIQQFMYVFMFINLISYAVYGGIIYRVLISYEKRVMKAEDSKF